MLPLATVDREHQRDGDRDPQAGEQLLGGVHAQAAAVEIEERVRPHQARAPSWARGRAQRCSPRAVAESERGVRGSLHLDSSWRRR